MNPTLFQQSKRVLLKLSALRFTQLPPHPTPPRINWSLLSGTWQLVSLHQRGEELPQPPRKLIIPLHFHRPRGHAVYISQSVNTDAAGIREDGDDGSAGDLINSNVAMLSQVYLGVLVYNVAANKQGRRVRAANRKSGIPKLLRITKMMELKKQNGSIFGGIKVV